LPIVPLTKQLNATVSVPGSKSITNRALVLAALTDGDRPCRLVGGLQSEDTEVMIAAIQQLGIDIHTDWAADCIRFPVRSHRGIPVHSADLFVANSGTTMRFLTAFVATGEGRYRLDGIARMRERPIRDLLDALNQLEGVKASSENVDGYPPVIVESKGIRGGRVKIRASVSSQFLSGLLMAAPRSEKPVTIEVEGATVSEPYIAMTLKMMEQWGHKVERPDSQTYRILPCDGYLGPEAYAIEPDASAASYFWAAAAIAGGRVTVSGLNRKSLQGDVRFVDFLQQMGCRVEECDAGITVHGKPLHGIDADMNDISDTVMTLGAVACFAEGATTIRNVAHIRHKETDRIAALATELRRLGAES